MNDIATLTTAAIITGTICFFLYFWFQEKRATDKVYNALDSITAFINWLETKPASLANAPANLSFEHTSQIVMHNNEQASISKLGGKVITKCALEDFLPPLPESSYRFVPALLTSVGVMGTFLGISLGLAGTSIEDQGSNQLMNSAINLLSGMTTAFYTSLAGLFCSIAFMIILNYQANSRARLMEASHMKLLDLCTPISLHDLFSQISGNEQNLSLESITDATRVLAKSNEKVISTLAIVDKLMSVFSGPELVASIGFAVEEATKRQLVPEVLKISEELSAIKDFKNETAKTISETLIAELRNEILMPFSQRIDQLSQSIDRSSTATERLVNDLGAVLTKLSDTTEVLQNFQTDTLEKLQTFAESLKTTLNDFNNDTQGVLKQVAEEISALLQQSIEGLKYQREAFEESSKSAANAFQDQTAMLQKIGLETANLMQSANKELSEGLADIDTKVISISTVVQEELERFRTEYQNNLTAFFNSQTDLLTTTFDKQKDVLLAAVTEYKEAFETEHLYRLEQYEGLDQQFSALQESTKLVSDLVEVVGLNKASAFSQLEQTAQVMSKQVGYLQKEYGAASEQFRKLSEAMPEAMHQYFTEARQNTEIFFKDLDEQAANVHGRLAEAANFLVTAMQQIQIEKRNDL